MKIITSPFSWFELWNIFMILGLSCKTQEIYLIVFCMRYIDLFMYYISLYNTLMKVFFISSTAFIVYLMRYKKPYCTVSFFDNYFDPFSNIDLWFDGRRLPPLESFAASCSCAYMHCSIGMECVGTDLVIQSLVGGSRFLTPNHYVEQNQNSREYHFPLCCLSRSLQILIHFELGL